MRRTTVLLAVLALTGCGGHHARRPPPTRAAFDARADRVCTNATTHAVRIAGLRALRPPKGGEDLFGRWVDAERDARQAAKDILQPPAKIKLDPTVALAIAQGKIAGYARRLGALDCARTATGTLPP
jgi:hypothetical protein